MELDTRCGLCQRFDEDRAHLFFKCKWIRRLWREMGLEKIRVEQSVLPDAAQCVEYVMALPSGLRGQVAILLNNWWWERNRVREGMRGSDKKWRRMEAMEAATLETLIAMGEASAERMLGGLEMS